MTTQITLTEGMKFILNDITHPNHGKVSVITNVGKTKISFINVNPEERQVWMLGAKKKNRMVTGVLSLKYFNEQIEKGRFIIK